MDDQPDVIVTLADARALRLCNAGSRRIAAHYGLSWDRFITQGYPASTLRALGDPMFDRVIAQAYKRVAR